MSNRTMYRFLILIILFLFPLLSFAEYKLVIKKNGKIIEGKLVSEDETSVTIVSAGARLRYLKETLDLERMKELNVDYQIKKDVKTIDRAAPASQKKPKSPRASAADVAKQNRDAQDDSGASSADSNEQSLVDWLAKLEEKYKISPTPQMQIELSKTKKALSHYRSRETRELSNIDRKLMLGQLVKALDFVYRRELEAGAPDEKTAAIKKRIEKTTEQLSELE